MVAPHEVIFSDGVSTNTQFRIVLVVCQAVIAPPEYNVDTLSAKTHLLNVGADQSEENTAPPLSPRLLESVQSMASRNDPSRKIAPPPSAVFPLNTHRVKRERSPSNE